MSEAIVEVRGNRKERVGVVVSDVQDKTIVVKGDTVRIVETRPLSRSKRWRLVEIISRAAQE